MQTGYARVHVQLDRALLGDSLSKVAVIVLFGVAHWQCCFVVLSFLLCLVHMGLHRPEVNFFQNANP